MPEMTTVAEGVAAHAMVTGHGSPLHRAVHGTDDPDRIAGQLRALTRTTLGARVARDLFHVASAGSVTGLLLEDGRRVVVKAYQARWSDDFLAAVVAAQRELREAGLPCARPLAGPVPIGAGWATVEEHLADPGQPSTFGPAEMRASAQGLALVTRALMGRRTGDLHRNPLARPFEGLYPEPHSPLFDFEATGAGAEWIDELAVRARRNVHRGPMVATHTDWSARNVRLTGTGVEAVYDLDSLAVVPAGDALGQAAVTWRSTGEVGDEPAPGVDEITDWLALWPEALADDVRRGALASALFHLAYSARCEHAVDPHGDLHRRARPTLRRDGEALARGAGA